MQAAWALLLASQDRPANVLAAQQSQPSSGGGGGGALDLFSLLAAGLLAFANLFYVFVYTIWLKRRTPQNIVIGGAAGAFPPMIGWAAVSGDLSLLPVLLFAIIFMWTPPHFWALALFVQTDYAKVGIPMLPVVAGEAVTRRQILIYAVLLLPLAAVARHDGHARLFHQRLGRVLQPHGADRGGRRSTAGTRHQGEGVTIGAWMVTPFRTPSPPARLRLATPSPASGRGGCPGRSS